MSEGTDGEAIARERIAQEADERTGDLDLGTLGLTELPDALFDLKHIKRLNLGALYGDELGAMRPASANIAPNEPGPSLARLQALPNLRALSLRSCRLNS
jgi:hypothetical protein